MTASRWLRIQELFRAALAKKPDEREAFLVEACDGDRALRRELMSLISAHKDPENLEDAVIQAEEAMLRESDPDAMVGRRLGAYRVLRLLGQGGMSTVYLATRVDDAYEKQEQSRRQMDSIIEAIKD